MANRVSLDSKQWKAFIDGVGKKMKNAYPKLRSAVMVFGFKDIIDHFSKEEGENGRWKPRKASTQRSYSRKGKAGNKLLQDTGALRGSLIHGQTEKVGANNVLMFTQVPYAGRHNYGKGMPKREFMWLSDKALDNIAKMFLDETID